MKLVLTHYGHMLRYSVLPALLLDGILYVKIVEGSFTYDLFGEFIDGLLDQMNPYPGLNSVIVMDNCCVHKSPHTLERIIDRYVIFVIPTRAS